MNVPIWILVMIILTGVIGIIIIFGVVTILLKLIKRLANDSGHGDLAAEFQAAYIQQYWKYLGVAKDGKPMKVGIYGGGSHTEWIFKNASRCAVQGPEVKALIDDNFLCASYWGLFPVKLDELNIEGIDAIIISTDVYNRKLWEKCKEKFNGKIQIIDFYENMPRGPYPKTDWM